MSLDIIDLLISISVNVIILFSKYENGKEATEMKVGPGKSFKRFQEILENNFSAVEKEAIDGLREQFQQELRPLGLGPADVLKNMIHYFGRVFWTAELRTTDRPLHNSRDFALSLYANVFSDMVAGLKKGPARRIDFLMFLAGIIDDPYSPSPMSEDMNRIMRNDETVLITGETGTGKELHAKVIHYGSDRRKHPFIPLNCAGIPETLIESTLFGHEKGAFSGAVKSEKGFLEEVGEGTLFLDEIGDMPPSLQSKLLRVLQAGDYYSVGNRKKIFRGRVVAATNRNLQEDIKTVPPRFRPDLFYRLNVLPITLKSLNELPDADRKTAILNKLRHIIYSKSRVRDEWSLMAFLFEPNGALTVMGADGEPEEITQNPYISNEALELLAGYKFPGNYREMENFLLRAYIRSDGKKIEVAVLPHDVTDYRETEPLRAIAGTINVESICLKDIIGYADSVKKDIVRRRLESVYRSGKTLTGALATEGITEKKDYQNIWKKFDRIVGREEMKRIVRPA